jgi:acyl-CoA thioesterase-1
MRVLAAGAVVGAALVLAVEGSAQDQARRPPRPHPSLAPIEDDPALPRVLLIGDSISMGYTLPVRELLKGKANVHRIPTNGGPTTRGVAHLAKWLGDGPWDVIHFNWGLHDLKKDEQGAHQVPIGQYEANLRQLVAQLKATGATLLWASTTPVPDAKVEPPRSNADVLAYNAVAKTIMDESGIALDDLYAIALPKLAELQRPANVHFTPHGSDVLGEAVAKAIETALPDGDGN